MLLERIIADCLTFFYFSYLILFVIHYFFVFFCLLFIFSKNSMYFNRDEAEARGRTDSTGELAREMASKAVDDLRNLKDKASDWFSSMRN
jgi:hypothetical protein